MDQMVKNVPAMWETWVWSLGWEDPLEGMATHSSILAWRIPMDRGAWRAACSPWGCKELDMTERLSTCCIFPRYLWYDPYLQFSRSLIDERDRSIHWNQHETKTSVSMWIVCELQKHHLSLLWKGKVYIPICDLTHKTFSAKTIKYIC